MSRKIKVIGVRRREIDADKLALAFILMATRKVREERERAQERSENEGAL